MGTLTVQLNGSCGVGRGTGVDVGVGGSGLGSSVAVAVRDRTTCAGGSETSVVGAVTAVGVDVGVGVDVEVFVGVGKGVLVGSRVGDAWARAILVTILVGVTCLVVVGCSATLSATAGPPMTLPTMDITNIRNSNRPAQLMPSMPFDSWSAPFSSLDPAI